ncbi:MAG: hypothetical protein ABSH38_06485 [Verrucomicrobiota bacterium]|jgi:hypothetical protein
MSDGPDDTPKPAPQGDAAEEEEEVMPTNRSRVQRIRIFIGKGFSALFLNRRSKLRAGICGGISAFFITFGGIMFKVHHTPPWVAISLVSFGILWLVPGTWQFCVNYGSTNKFAYICSSFVLVPVIIGIALAFWYEYRPDRTKPPEFAIASSPLDLSDFGGLAASQEAAANRRKHILSISNPNGDVALTNMLFFLQFPESILSITGAGFTAVPNWEPQPITITGTTNPIFVEPWKTNELTGLWSISIDEIRPLSSLTATIITSIGAEGNPFSAWMTNVMTNKWPKVVCWHIRTSQSTSSTTSNVKAVIAALAFDSSNRTFAVTSQNIMVLASRRGEETTFSNSQPIIFMRYWKGYKVPGIGASRILTVDGPWVGQSMAFAEVMMQRPTNNTTTSFGGGVPSIDIKPDTNAPPPTH